MKDIIRRIMETEKINLEETANILGFSYSYISKVLYGHRNGSLKLLNKIKEHFPTANITL